MKRKIPIGRIIASVIAVILLSVGIFFLLGSSICRQRFYQWQKDKPIRLKVDLSKPGSYSSQFIHTCSTSDGQYLYVETPKEPNSWEGKLELVKGIRGNLSIIDSNNTAIITNDFTEDDFEKIHGYSEPNVPALSFYSFPPGTYTLKLTIHDGAPALSGQEHSIVCRHELRGLELLVAAMLRGQAIICFIIAAIIIGIVVLVTLRRKKKKQISESDSPDQSPKESL